MTLEELRNLLKEQGVLFEELPMQNGTQVQVAGVEKYSTLMKLGQSSAVAR